MDYFPDVEEYRKLLHFKIVCFPTNCVDSSVSQSSNIRIMCPCNIYPLIPHLYTAKLGFAEVYLFSFFLLQN